MNSVDGKRLNSNDLIEVNCITLENIFNTQLKNKTVDLLSLDVEGYEYNILEGLNLDKNRPKFMLIEIYNKDYEYILTSRKPDMGVFCSLFTKPDNNDFIYEVIIKKV
jgi:hypothetical protein